MNLGKRTPKFSTLIAKNAGLRAIISAVVFIIFISVFFVFNLVVPAPGILKAERRIPARLPDLSLNSILSGNFTNRLDNYVTDRFIFRDTFRRISSFIVLDLFMQTDKSGLYVDSYGVGKFKQIDQASIELVSDKIKTVAGFLDGVNIYYSFIPDKSVYSNRVFPGFDSELTARLMSERLDSDEFSFVDLTDVLSAESFYRTDLHWDQVMIKGVVDKLGECMGYDVDFCAFSGEYAGEFHGAYAGQLALPVKEDSLRFFSVPKLSAKYLNEFSGELEIGSI